MCCDVIAAWWLVAPPLCRVMSREENKKVWNGPGVRFYYDIIRIKIMYSKTPALTNHVTKKVWTIFGKKGFCAIFAMLTFFGHLCFTITAEYCCNASSWSPPIQCLWPAAQITSKHASRSPHCKSYLVFNFLLQQFSPNLLHHHHNRKSTTDQFYPWSFCYSKTAAKYGYYCWHKSLEDYTRRLDFEMFICFLAPGYVFREH